MLLVLLALTLVIQGIGTATLRTHGAAHVHRSVHAGTLERAVLQVFGWLRADADRFTHAALAGLDGHRGVPDLQAAGHDHHHDEVGHHHHEPGTPGIVVVESDDHSAGKSTTDAQRHPHDAAGWTVESLPVPDREVVRHLAAADAPRWASHVSEPLERPPRAA